MVAEMLTGGDAELQALNEGELEFDLEDLEGLQLD